MSISRPRHITSMAISLSGALMAGRDRSPGSALLGGVFLDVGSIRRRGPRR